MSPEDYTGYPHYAFVQEFETRISKEWGIIWFKNHWHYSLYIALIYLISVFVLQEYMKNRPPAQIQKVVMIWNTSLAIFSICGMLRAIPEITYVLWNYGMEFSVCNTNANNVSVFWAMAFVLSKAPELLDTIFLVLKKQKLTVLHLTHHVLSMTILWAYAQNAPGACRWIIALNFTVHSFMYSYFALKTAKFNIPIKVSMILTTAQIAQFAVGLIVAPYALKANLQGHECTTGLLETVVGLTFALYLLFMFVNFFIHRYKVDSTKKKSYKLN